MEAMIKHHPASERPRERLLRSGARGLSLRELLAVLLGVGPPGRGCLGLARDLLQAYGHPYDSPEAERSLFLALESSGTSLLPAQRGLGIAGRCRVAAAFELGRRYALMREQERDCPPRMPPLRSVERQVLAKLTDDLRSAVHEWLGFIPVYRNGVVGSLCVVAQGSRHCITVDQQDLFRQVLNLRPSAIFLVHNHPSGALDPSPEDDDLTRRVARLCSVFQIPLLDHLIVAGTNHRSLRNRRS